MLRDRAAPGVEVGQHHPPPSPGQLRGDGHRDRRAPGSTGGSPDDDDTTGLALLARLGDGQVRVGLGIGHQVLGGGPSYGVGEVGDGIHRQHLDHADPGQPAHALGADREGADVVPQQMGDGCRVEAGQLRGDHGDVGLAGPGGGEQVSEVDAALEHDQAGARQRLERAGLPRGAGGRDQRRPCGPRRPSLSPAG